MIRFIKQAFTLIELLVVIAIIGILSGLIVVSMSGVTQKATTAKSQVFSNSLRNSLMANIIAEWKFDGPSSDGAAATANDVLDTWGGINNGTIPASPAIPTVRTGSNCVSVSCLSFNGDDYVDIGSTALNNLNKGTFEIWGKLNTLGVTGDLFYLLGAPTQASDEAGLRVSNTGGVWGTPNNGQGAFSTALAPIDINKWYHYVMTWDGVNARLYINSNLIQTIVFSFNSSTGSRSNYIGKGWDGKPWDGLMDNVRIYNAPMSAFQIREQYYIGLNKLLVNGGITSEEYQDRRGELAIK